jgi:energy-coupling factor transporter transmembrane protein EcfT
MENIFPSVFLGGLALAAVGFLALVVIAFRVRWWWGLSSLLFFPIAFVFALKHFRRSRIPLGMIVLGLVMAGFPPAYTRLMPIDLGPRERIVGGETHVTLTGWDRSDYSFLTRKPEIVVLQMANADVTDATLSYLKDMKRLRELDLNDSGVTDAGLAALAGLPTLESLRLRNTKVSDKGLADSLARLDGLKQLDLRGTDVSREAVQSWRDAKPGRRALQ